MYISRFVLFLVHKKTVKHSIHPINTTLAVACLSINPHIITTVKLASVQRKDANLIINDQNNMKDTFKKLRLRAKETKSRMLAYPSQLRRIG